MSINPLSPNLQHLFDPTPISGNTGRTIAEGGSFSDILTESLENAGSSDFLDKKSSSQLLLGINDDLSGMLIDAQKAELALNFALQIRNKVIDAYNEVMRMSV